MGTRALRKRTIWQDVSGEKAEAAERNFHDIFTEAFNGTDFRIRAKPREFKDIYSAVALSPEVLSAIYRPDTTWTHGIVPDYAIDNIKTKRTLYVEVKRQDGWVEGKPPSAGRGNAHERLAKFFTPGLLKLLRERGRLDNNALPFWVVLQGDIARDPKRVREMTFWFAEHAAHFYMWSDAKDGQALIAHFDRNLKQLLL